MVSVMRVCEVKKVTGQRLYTVELKVSGRIWSFHSLDRSRSRADSPSIGPAF